MSSASQFNAWTSSAVVRRALLYIPFAFQKDFYFFSTCTNNQFYSIHIYPLHQHYNTTDSCTKYISSTMATSSKTQGADKKLTLNEAANKIAKEYPNIFTSPNESKLFEEDFKLLVRTYVMDGCMVRRLPT